MTINGNQKLSLHMMGIFLKQGKNIKVVDYQIEWVIMAQKRTSNYYQRKNDRKNGSLGALALGSIGVSIYFMGRT